MCVYLRTKCQIPSTILTTFRQGVILQHLIHSKSENIKLMIYDKADKVIKELFQSPFSRYQIVFETSMKGSHFIFDCINLLYYKCHKINLNHGVSYIDSPD